MKNKSYSHITSFADFQEEKMRLYYEIKLSEKKLEIKRMELESYVNPIRFLSSIFGEIAKPLFDLFKGLFKAYKQKRRNKDYMSNEDEKKSSDNNKNSSED